MRFVTMRVSTFFQQEYSLIISIIGTIIGLIMSIVGSTQNKEAVKKIGALLLILFVVCCGIVLYYRNSSETSAITEESASFEEPTNFEDSALTDVATTPTDNNELITITTKQNESDINTDSSDSYLNNIEFIVPVITYSQYSITLCVCAMTQYVICQCFTILKK